MHFKRNTPFCVKGKKKGRGKCLYGHFRRLYTLKGTGPYMYVGKYIKYTEHSSRLIDFMIRNPVDIKIVLQVNLLDKDIRARAFLLLFPLFFPRRKFSSNLKDTGHLC